MGNKKFTKVGQVLRKKDNSGNSVKLGVFSKDPKFATSVDIRVRNAAGDVIAGGTDCYLLVQDPRQRPGITEEQASKIPEFVLDDLVLVSEE